MKYMFVVLLIVAIVATTVFADRAPEGDPANYTLLKCVEKNDVVAIGYVMTMTGVYRQNMPPHNTPQITTDVLIRVGTLIKGETNFGSKHLKLMILGGTAYVAKAWNYAQNLDSALRWICCWQNGHVMNYNKAQQCQELRKQFV